MWTPSRRNRTGGTRSACVVISLVSIGLYLHDLSEVRRVHHGTSTHVETYVVDIVECAVENEVTRQQWLPGWNVGTSVELGLGGARQGHSGGGVSRLGQTRTVETRVPAIGSVATPDIRKSSLPAGVVDRGNRDRVGGLDGVAVARADSGGSVGVLLGLVEYLVHVPVGVVVGEDRRPQITPPHSVVAEHEGGGVD